MNLLTNYTHDSELQAITAISLIYYTLYKSLEYTPSLLSPLSQVSRFLVTDLNNADSFVSVFKSLPTR
jgi:hypothetical protein